MSGSYGLQLRAGDVVAKRFEVDGTLGVGPCGASYRVRRLDQPGRAVLKLIAGPAAPAPVAEDLLRRVRRVDSDRMVVPTDTGDHLGMRWVAMPEAEGESLRRLMDTYAGEKRSFSLQEACQIVAQVLEGLCAAHERGLVHRLVKPNNAVVQTRKVEGRFARSVRVTGLGLLELVHPAVLQEGLAERADSRYLAPELSFPSQGATAQADVYSVGVVFYELLCGQTPEGTYLSPTQLRDDLPMHVDDIIDIAIAANPEDRYPSARDMINDLHRAFHPAPERDPPWWRFW